MSKNNAPSFLTMTAISTAQLAMSLRCNHTENSQDAAMQLLSHDFFGIPKSRKPLSEILQEALDLMDEMDFADDAECNLSTANPQ
jgi:hypothetical protein